MDLQSLSHRKMTTDDIGFVKELIYDSSDWQENECTPTEFENYLKTYESLDGEWRIWYTEQPFAVSYHINKARSNGQPWLGTILVKKEYHKNGIAKKIIQTIANEYRELNEDVLFSSAPLEAYSWVEFLGKCGFEQLKVENNEDDIPYLIFIYPLKS